MVWKHINWIDVIISNKIYGLKELPSNKWHTICLSHGPWWRHQMEIFSTSLALCAGNSPVTGEFPAQRPEMWSFDVFFDLCLNKRLSKQSWGWWFEMPLHSLWRHCYGQFLACLLCVYWKHDPRIFECSLTLFFFSFWLKSYVSWNICIIIKSYFGGVNYWSSIKDQI